MDARLVAATIGGVFVIIAAIIAVTESPIAIVAGVFTIIAAVAWIRFKPRKKGEDHCEEVVVWTSRDHSYPKLVETIKNTTDGKITAHDSVWLGTHRVQVALLDALARGVEVDLILADPQSEIYEYRSRLIIGAEKHPVAQDFTWIKDCSERYKKFQLSYTEHLFSGPFVLVDDVLYLGIFSPKTESNLLPLFEISVKTKAGKELATYIEDWKNSLPRQTEKS